MNLETLSASSFDKTQDKSGQAKNCQNCKQKFVIESDDFQFYEKIKVPVPTWCPECRMTRRFIWRQEHNLYRRPDSNSGAMIFSSIPASAPVKVYDLEFWNSDNWDPMDYGRDYDFSRPFFEQFREFLAVVPWPSRGAMNLVNSDYSANASDLKNCYLCFDLGRFENCAYCIGGDGTKDSFDLYQSRHAELSYEGYMIDECYRTLFSINCEDCHDVWFSRNLVGCQNCFGCVNLRNKSYHLFNRPVSKDEYQSFIKKFKFDSYLAVSEMRKKVAELWLQHPMRFTLGINNVNCTGEHIEHSKNVRESFMVHEGQNMKYCQIIDTAQDCYDYTVWGQGSSLIYESLQVGNSCERVKFSNGCWPASSNIEYSMHCRSSADLFGCVSLKKKQYCIFNKQYSKDEYFALREKIIKHMDEMPYISEIRNSKHEIRKIEYKYGEFFPPEFSPFGYNETIANDFLPLTKEEALKRGYRWLDSDIKEYQTTIRAEDLPDSINDISEEILKEVIRCAKCGKAYRVIQMELNFYKRMGIPVPRLCVNCRFEERFKFVNPPKFWPAKCQCGGLQSDKRHVTSDREFSYQNTAKHFHGDEPCPKEFMTSYAPGRPEIVYCESCYQNEVI